HRLAGALVRRFVEFAAALRTERVTGARQLRPAMWASFWHGSFLPYQPGAQATGRGDPRVRRRYYPVGEQPARISRELDGPGKYPIEHRRAARLSRKSTRRSAKEGVCFLSVVAAARNDYRPCRSHIRTTAPPLY